MQFETIISLSGRRGCGEIATYISREPGNSGLLVRVEALLSFVNQVNKDPQNLMRY